MLLGFKNKIKKERKKKREIAQNCKSPTQRQRFMTMIKNVTKKKVQSLIGYVSANKINNYNRGGRKGEKKKKKKNPKNLQNKSKHKNNKCFS